MAIVVIRQNNRGTNATSDVPYYVFDTTLAPGTELNRAMAVDAVFEQGLIDADGAEPYDYDYEQLSHHSAMIRLLYQNQSISPTAPQPPPPLEAGSILATFNAVSFQPTHKIHSLGNVWRLPAPHGIGEAAYGAAPNFLGLVDVQEWRGISNQPYGGYTLQLPPETDSLDYVIPNASFTAEYRQRVQGLLFRVHDGPGTFFGRNPGEVILVRAQAQQRTGDDLHLRFGFSYAKNEHRYVGDLNTSSISGAPIPDGHDLLWAVMFRKFVTAASGIQVEIPYPRWVYCERIWRRGNLNDLDLPGSAD